MTASNPEPVKILLVTHSYWPEQTPPQRRWQNFIKFLRGFGCEVAVLTQGVADHPSEELGPAGERIIRTGVTHRTKHSRWARLLESTIHAAEFIPLARRFSDVDIVIATVPALPNLVSGRVISKLLKKPFVVEMRDAWPDLLTEANVGGKVVSESASQVVTWLQRSADLLITVTQGFAQTLRERGMTNVATIRNGVSVSAEALLPSRSREPGELHVLYLGNHGESQNLALVLQAVALAQRQNSRIQLRFVGQGTQKHLLIKTNRSLGSPAELYDAVPSHRATEHYQWADTCVVSLRPDWQSFRHTVPSKLYELLATGKHITGLVQGEAAQTLRVAGHQPLGELTADQLASYWLELAKNPDSTAQNIASHRWAADNISLDVEASRLSALLGHLLQARKGSLATNTANASPSWNRTPQLLRNFQLAAQTARDHIGQDPALFALQVARRLPTSISEPVASVASKIHGGPLDVVGALGAAIRGNSESLREELCRAVEARAGSRKVLELVNLLTSSGDTEAAEWGLARVRPGGKGYRLARSRIQWNKGNMTAAVEGLKTSGKEGWKRKGYRSQLRTFQGERPQLARVPDYHPEQGAILHVLTNSLPYTGSGYAQRSHSILRALQSRGWNVSAATRMGWPVVTGGLTAPAVNHLDGIDYHRLIPRRLHTDAEKREQQYAEMLLTHALKVKPALLHTTSHWNNANAVRAVAEALDIPWVYEVRGLLADTWASTRGAEAYRSEYYRLFTQREQESVLAADGVVTLGKQMRAKLEEFDRDSADIVLTPNAIGGEFLKEPRSTQEAREALGLPRDLELVGTVSSLVPYEGLDTVVRAVAHLAPSRPRLRMLLVGDGTARPSLLRLAEKLGLSDRLIAPGRVQREESILYHHALDVFVVPRIDSSVTRTVTPMKSVEASASGKPVVASDLPALSELVHHGVTGMLVPPEHDIEWARVLTDLLDNPTLRQTIGHAGRSWALQERTWKSNESRYTELYQKLTGYVP
ncbi:glycosyltransferase [Auritidibacter ignavus]|uniref:glycosyltransferase n=1 Tax=Auritidibacter ignavus TaxID=678932 RepID=UPI002FE5AD07